MLKFIVNIFNGMAFGVANIIPGMSAGTVAVILGFYERLIESVNHFFEKPKESLKFLIPLLIGVAAGILVFASLIDYLLENHSFPVMMLFIGMIIGVIPLLWKKVRSSDKRLAPRFIVAATIPMVALIIVSHLRGASLGSPEEIMSDMSVMIIALLFVAGVISAAAMIIPGVSGSLMLLLMGVYPLVTHSISQLRFLLSDFSTELLVNILLVLGPLAVGIIIGLLSMMRLIEKLLKKNERMVYACILGFITGSVYLLFREPTVYQSGVSPLIIVIGAVTFVLGALASYALAKKKM